MKLKLSPRTPISHSYDVCQSPICASCQIQESKLCVVSSPCQMSRLCRRPSTHWIQQYIRLPLAAQGRMVFLGPLKRSTTCFTVARWFLGNLLKRCYWAVHFTVGSQDPSQELAPVDQSPHFFNVDKIKIWFWGCYMLDLHKTAAQFTWDFARPDTAVNRNQPPSPIMGRTRSAPIAVACSSRVLNSLPSVFCGSGIKVEIWLQQTIYGGLRRW